MFRYGTTFLIVLTIGTGTVNADGGNKTLLLELQRELAALRERVAELEQELYKHKPSASVSSPPEVHVAVPPDPIQPVLQSSANRQTRFDLGGRIKLDLIANSTSVGGAGGSNPGDFALDPADIPLGGSGERDQISFSARSTRLWLKAFQPSAAGDIAALAEMDFFGSTSHNERVSNSYGPRLRHAYVVWRGWTAGHTFSTFMNASAFPELNDDGIPAGVVIARQPLLRKQFDLGAFAIEAAMESPETTITAADSSRISPDDDRLPDWVVRASRAGAFGNVALAGMLRELRIDDRSSRGMRDATYGYGLNLSGRIQIGRDDDVRFGLVGGNAIGRYLTSNAFNDARADRRGGLHLPFSTGGFTALRHWWNATWRSTLAAGVAWQDDQHHAALENEWLATVHANLLYSPASSTTVGIEWIHAWRRRFDGADGHLNRLQFTILHTL